VTENPPTESLDDDRDGLRWGPARYAQQPCQPQPPPAAPPPLAAPSQPWVAPPAWPRQPPTVPAYASPPGAYAPQAADRPRDNVGGPPGMLASTADRERAIDICKASYGEGRLTKQEFDARVAQVSASRTYGDLAAVISDLPAGPLGGVSHYQAGGYPMPVVSYPPPVRPTNGTAIGALVCALMGISLPAVIMGHIARAQIREKNEAGDGLAVAGLVIGWVGIACWTLLFIAAITVAHR
jgi:hypothetical protein